MVTTAPRRLPCGAVRHRLRIGLLAGLALGAWLLAGCGAPDPASQPPPPAPEQAASIVLPWPVADPAGVQLLQQRVDAGSQPWLLEPAEVAQSFATAAYGWSKPEVVISPDSSPAVPSGVPTDPPVPEPAGPAQGTATAPGGVDVQSVATTADVNGPDGRSAHLILEQPGRTGRGGIWVVTAASGP